MKKLLVALPMASIAYSVLRGARLRRSYEDWREAELRESRCVVVDESVSAEPEAANVTLVRRRYQLRPLKRLVS
jgi:hypothetical protein